MTTSNTASPLSTTRQDKKTSSHSSARARECRECAGDVAPERGRREGFRQVGPAHTTVYDTRTRPADKTSWRLEVLASPVAVSVSRRPPGQSVRSHPTVTHGGIESRRYDSSARRATFASARRSMPHFLASGPAAFSIQRRLDWLARWATIEMGDDTMRRGDRDGRLSANSKKPRRPCEIGVDDD